MSNQKSGIVYRGPITIYFAKPLLSANDSGAGVSFSTQNAIVMDSDPRALTVINEDDGSLLQINFDHVILYHMHNWMQQETPDGE